MICAVIKGPDLKAIYQQIEKVTPHADLIELRLDLFEGIDQASLMQLRKATPLPMIFTLRSQQQGGSDRSLLSDHLQHLRSLLALNPEYLDVESHLPSSFFEEMQQHYPKIKVICSYHDFTHTPDDLDTLYQTLKQKPAFYYKIAVMANSSIDALRGLCWTKQQDKQLIAVSMGPLGEISRILAPIVGSLITYASVDEDLKTAPGQCSLETLLGIYRYRSLAPKTKVYGLIGEIVDKSMSDETHNALMKAAGIDAVYVKMSVRPDQLKEALKLIKQLPFSGMSVTMPLKELVIPHLDHIDPIAEKIGAVNTLVFRNDQIHGFNTDGIGALQAIEKSFPIKDKKVVILGAGGAAKAIAYEASRRGAQVIILNRDKEKAVSLAKSLGGVGKGLDQMKECYLEGYDLLVNCTPLDMPINKEFIIPFCLVMDIKTRPKAPLFLEEAKKKNCDLIYGYQMFVEQAVGQFDLWFDGGVPTQMSREIIEGKVLELL